MNMEYNTSQFTPETPTAGRPRKSLQWRWVAVVLLAAAVGSGSTLAVNSILQRNNAVAATPQATNSSQTSSLPTVANVQNVSVTSGITKVAEAAKPAVMGVVNYQNSSDGFFQQDQPDQQSQAAAVGTGTLFYKDQNYGYIVTNNHVVEGADKVEVVLESGQHVQATVVGADPFTDLAVLKIPVKAVANVTPLPFGNSDNLEAGQPAIAIGTPEGLDFADTVTSGIISAPKRLMPIEDTQTGQVLDSQVVIQTDAAINPGNSGGPLLNIAGQVIGINSSKIAAQGVEGMGFAIPSNEVRNIAEQIIRTGHAVHPSLGIEGYSLDSLPQRYWPDVPVNYGVWVRTVSSDQAKAAGLQSGDVIVAIDGHPVNDIADLRTYLFQKQVGDKVSLKIYRGQNTETLQVTLGAMSVPNSSW
jgi:serine protease Do